MSYLPFALTAYLLNGAAVLIDKFMLSKYIPNPLVYIFYFSVFSLVIVLLIPFTPLPTLGVFILASLSTILWTFGSYNMLKCLQIGQTARVIPIIGALVPTLLLVYYGLISESISGYETIAGFILTLGLVILIIPYIRGKIDAKELSLEVTSALLFAASYIILKHAYGQAPYLTVFAWSRIILIPVGIIMLLLPKIRRLIFSSNGPRLNFFSRPGLLFLFGQACGGTSELLITFSISLASPALVNSLQGIQYIFLFLISLILSKYYPKIYQEKFSYLGMIGKLAGIVTIGLGLYLLSFGSRTS